MINPSTYLVAGAVALAIFALFGFVALWIDSAAAKRAGKQSAGQVERHASGERRAPA